MQIEKDHKKFERPYHLEYFPLPGGEKAIFETDRIAISLASRSGVAKIPGIKDGRISMIKELIDSGINTPDCSSLGRLFDGVSAMLGICVRSDYEANAAILLQKYAEDFNDQLKNAYPVELGSGVIKYNCLVKNILDDLANNVSKQEVALKFHAWVCDSIIGVVSLLKPELLVYSGGCFQNALLVNMLIDRMNMVGIKNYYFNKSIPTNDAGVSFGQSLF